MLRTTQSRLRHVALLIESSRGIGRDILQGVIRYNAEHESWTIYFEPRGLETEPPPWLQTWRGDGILSRIATPRMAKAVCATGLPVVDLRGSVMNEKFLYVLPDNTRIVQLAFEHLRSRGLRHFAFCGLPRELCPSYQRSDEFRQVVESAGFTCPMFLFQRTAADWEQNQEQLGSWLRALPKPIGILAGHDGFGYQVMEACRRAKLRVPGEVAVVSVDNDPILCNLSIPPLSSIDLNGPRIGYEAAAWLDRLMRGRKPPPGPILIEPSGLVVRHSSDVFAFDDPEVIAAARFIHDHACEGIRVTDVLKVVNLPQWELERRFQQYLGHTPKAELLRVQIERAQRLLRETELPLKTIASRAGFSSEKYFSDAFLRQTDMRPATYRKRLRGPAP